MTIPFFVLVIEKVEGTYVGYTPNVLEVSARSTSREDVERSLLEQINLHIEELNSRHATGSHRLELSIKPIQEKISCLETIAEGHRYAYTCKAPAKKDGLCWQHWKLRYSHAPTGPAHSRSCELCGERDPFTIRKWDAPCEFKATHPDWPTVLKEKRQATQTAKRVAAETERRRKEIEALPVRCAAIRTQGPKGVQCSNMAQRDGLCTNHWKLEFGNLQNSR